MRVHEVSQAQRTGRLHVHSDAISADPARRAAWADVALSKLPETWRIRTAQYLQGTESTAYFERMAPQQVIIRLLKLIDVERSRYGARPTVDDIDAIIREVEEDELAAEALDLLDLNALIELQALPPVEIDSEHTALLRRLDGLLSARLGQWCTVYLCSVEETERSVLSWLAQRGDLRLGRYDGLLDNPPTSPPEQEVAAAIAAESARLLEVRDERLREYWNGPWVQ